MGFVRSFRRQMNRRMKQRDIAAKKRSRKMLLEPLEPRILLSSDPLSYTAAGAAMDITLRLQEVEGSDTLQLIDNNNNQSVLQSKLLAETVDVVITGGEYSDKLTIDFSIPFTVSNGILFSDAFSGDNDTLKLTGKSNVWNVTGNNRGNVDDAGLVDFLGVENLTGGSDADTFVLTADGSLDGTIDGGEGTDSLEGADTNNTWDITALDAGALNEQIYENIENLIGGDAQDIFVLGDGAGVTGLIDGGGGVNTLDYSAYTTDINVDLEACTASGIGAVSNIQNVTGGAGSDNLTGDGESNVLAGGPGNDILTGGLGADIIDGGEGTDTITESSDADFTLIDTDLTIGSEGTDDLFGIEQANLTGGTSANIFNASAFTGLATLIGEEGDDTFYAGLVNATFQGGGGSDTLVGDDKFNDWDITGVDSGLLNGSIFEGIENLIGGAVADSFVLATGALATGLIDGRQGNDRLVGGNTTNIWKIAGAKAGKLNEKSFTDIENFEGGTGEDTLIGPDADTTWYVTGANAGNVAGFEFSGMENLEGAADNEDTFVIKPTGSISGNVEGGSGGFDSLIIDGGAYSMVTYNVIDSDTGIIERDSDQLTFSGLEPATDTSTGPKTVNATTGVDSITITGSGGGITVSGATLPETYVFTNPGNVTVNALGGDDKLTIQSLGSYANTLNVDGGNNDDTITLQAISSSATYQINGGGPTTGTGDTVQATANENMILSDSALIVGSNSVALTSIESADLTISGALKTFSADSWSGNDPVVNTQTIDGSLPGTVSSTTIATLKTALDNLVFRINDIQTAGSDLAQLANQLPFLDREIDGGLADVAGLSDAFEDFVDEAKTALDGLGGTPSIADVVTAMDLLPSTVPDFFDTFTLTVDSVYRVPSGGSSPLEVLFVFDLDATVNDASFDIDLGAEAEALGIDIDATVEVDAKLAADFTIGLPGDTPPVAFLAPGGTITLTVDDATATLSNTPINLSFLEMTATGTITLDGEIEINIIEDSVIDGRIFLHSFNASVFDIQPPTDPDVPDDAYLTASLTLNIGSGVTVGGLDLNGAAVDLGLAITGSPFGDGTVPTELDITHLTATIGSTTIDLLNFSNITPNEVLGMLGGVLDTLTAMASSQFMQTSIPYTDVTIGDVLDFGQSFKEDVLDPLFKEYDEAGNLIAGGIGDFLNPDSNRDGVVDFDDLNFKSIQGLVSEIGDTLGIPLKAKYDNINNVLSFTIDFYRAFGLGDGEASTTTQGVDPTPGPAVSEIQELTFDTSTVEAFRLVFRDSSGNLQVTDVIPTVNGSGTPLANTVIGPDIDAKLEALSGITNTTVSFNLSDSGIFTVTFASSLGNVAQLGFAGELLLDFGAGLGDFASIETDGSFGLAAVLDTGLTFGINLSPSDELIITPALFSPDTGVSVSQKVGVTDNTVQVLTVDNANGGQFKLSLDNPNITDFGSVTSGIDSRALPGILPVAIKTAIETKLSADLNGALVDSITIDDTGWDRVIIITFDSSPGAMLGASSADDPNELVGPADNGRLSGNANFEVKVFNQPTVSIATITDGGDPANAEIKTSTVGSSDAQIEALVDGGSAQIETIIDSASILVETDTHGGGGNNETQKLTIDAAGGSFTLTLTDTGSIINSGVAQTTTAIAFDPSDLNQVALDIQTALTDDDFTGINSVTVDRVGSIFTITFTDPANTNLDLLSANINDTQELTIDAAGGSFTLTLQDPGINGGTAQTTAAITMDPEDLDQVATDIDTALTAFTDINSVDVTIVGSVFTIIFTNPANTNLDELSVNINEIQKLSIDATGGSFTLTLKILIVFLIVVIRKQPARLTLLQTT